MFNFFKRKGGKAEATPEAARKLPGTPERDARAATNSDVTNDCTATRKDVVNLLIPEVDYSQKNGVGGFLQMMAGKRKKNKKRRDSYRVSPPKEMQVNLQRSKSDVTPSDVVTKNTVDDVAKTQSDGDPAECVRALVLQKYTKPEKHVSLVYVGDQLDEKRHAEALLREIARSIDCTIDDIEKSPMGANDSKVERTEPVYETVEERTQTEINNYKNDLKGELEKLLKVEETFSKEESPSQIKKSNLKLPKSDTEGCSDDDRSDCGKKKVTFRKHIVFDDGDQQTDEEVDSSFESLTSEEEEEEYLEDSMPDHEEFDYVVEDNRTVIKVTDVDSAKLEDDGLKRISSDNSDSGFIDGEKNEGDDATCGKSVGVESGESESEVTESETEEEIIEEIVEIEEIEEEVEEEEESIAEYVDADTKHLDDK